MSFDKLKDFEEAAQKAEEEFLALTKPSDDAPSDDNAQDTQDDPNKQEEQTHAEDATGALTEQPVFDEEAYKKQVKAMNAAQKAASDAEKRLKEIEDRAKAEEDRYNQILEKARQASSTSISDTTNDEDGLEDEMPDVARLAERKAKGVLTPLEQRIQQLESRLKAEEEARLKTANEVQGQKMLAEIRTAHPDYDDVVNSDEMVAWVNNEAPPIYKKIFDGSVQFDAKDAIEVLNAFKRTTTPTQKASKNLPSAADIAAPVKSNPQVSNKIKSETPPTIKELEHFMHNSHKMTAAEIAEWDRRISLLTTNQ